MDSAKEIARDMLDAINVDGSGFLGAVAKGVISFPVSLVYLGYDFIDTEHRRENQDDKFRLARLVKTATFNKTTIEKAINLFIEDFSFRINMISMAENIGGSAVGKVIFSQLTGVNLANVISTRLVTVVFSGFTIGSLLSIGAESSRSIYTSRYLKERNPKIYYKLKDKGDLDLLYFLFEDKVKPFEQACAIGDDNSEEFDRVCKYFLGGL
ncbi:hypothetical protein [Erwinia sp. Leaf53]|uniref:hypothetical protein n=1 Tax=Erwinia sp. Leaf53 TaxID=1736225 RepID=UPI0006F4ED0F|nr:hypothetical protein [Erwinia sp. Leaf53]KQN58638.1 hypothetical protein ASF13_22765 [Erwinia sp. Leaf53]